MTSDRSTSFSRRAGSSDSWSTTRSERSGAGWLHKVGLPTSAPCCCPPPMTIRHGLPSVCASCGSSIRPAARCILASYAFDVLSFMYEEEGIEDRRDVPRLIIEENLVGIDIDRRAIQIAALNLYLKAATALSTMGEERPANLRMNLACADAAPPAAEHVRAMRESIVDPLLRDAFDVAITSLKSLHAVGSLLDPEADVRAALQARSAKQPAGVSPLPGLWPSSAWLRTSIRPRSKRSSPRHANLPSAP